MSFDQWSDDQVPRDYIYRLDYILYYILYYILDYIYQPARSSPATGQTHEYKALINLWPGAGGGVAGGGGPGGAGGGGGATGGGGTQGGGGGATGGAAGGVEGEGSFRKGAGGEDLSGMKIKWLDLECGLSRNSSCG